MRPWQLILLTLITGVSALSSGWRPLYLIFYVLLLSLVISYLIANWSSNGLAFARTNPGRRVQKGAMLEERLRLENRSSFPKLWVQVTDSSTLPGHHAGYVASIGGRQRIDWRVKTVCRRRGRFFLGPVVATTGDPLGLFTRVIPLSNQREVIVLPLALPLTHFALFPGVMPGRGRGSQRSLQTTTNAVTVREYLPGDAMSRIHWPSSARQSKLMVKEFDLDPTIDVWIILDLDDMVQYGEGDESTVEYAVTIAATLAQFCLRADLSVGLMMNDAHHTVLPFDRGVRQLDRMLETLAVAEASETQPLSDLLIAQEVRFMRNNFSIVITSSPDQEWAAGLRQLERRGVKGSVVLIDGASFGARADEGAPVPVSTESAERFLISNAMPYLVVHQGDSIAAALEVGAVTSRK